MISLDTVDRIFDLADAQFREQRDFAASLGVAASVVSAWRCRKSASYSKYIPKIVEVLGTTTEYLLTGEGPKKKTAPAAVPDSGTISEDEWQLVLAYRRADARAQGMVDLALEPYKTPAQSEEVM